MMKVEKIREDVGRPGGGNEAFYLVTDDDKNAKPNLMLGRVGYVVAKVERAEDAEELARRYNEHDAMKASIAAFEVALKAMTKALTELCVRCTMHDCACGHRAPNIMKALELTHAAYLTVPK